MQLAQLNKKNRFTKT